MVPELCTLINGKIVCFHALITLFGPGQRFWNFYIMDLIHSSSMILAIISCMVSELCPFIEKNVNFYGYHALSGTSFDHLKGKLLSAAKSITLSLVLGWNYGHIFVLFILGTDCISMSLSVTCDRSVVFSGFLHQ